MLLATKKQLAYLQHLTDEAEHIKLRHPSLIPAGITHTNWEPGMTSDKASARISYYNAILNQAHAILFPAKKVAVNEDLPA